MLSSQELGRRIATARKSKHLTQADLATALSIARTTVVAIEKGERRPSNDELIRIAHALHTEVHALLKEHAIHATISPRFRLGTVAGTTSLSLTKAVERLQLLATHYAELERLLGIERVPAPLESMTTYQLRPSSPVHLDPKLLGEDAASTVRNVLRLGDSPALSLDERFELEAGLRIFYPELPHEVAALFFWSDELGACIAINRIHPHERRRWSLCHEFGHFLRDRESGDILPFSGPKRHDPSEIFADAFTVAFLLPQMSISRQFADRLRAGGSRISIADIVEMAHFNEVSFQAMALRLEDLRLLKRGSYEDWRQRGFKTNKVKEKLGISHAPAKPRVFPPRYERLAFRAFAQELISESEFASYLEVDRVQARELYLAAQQNTLTEDESLTLDLGLDVAVEE